MLNEVTKQFLMPNSGSLFTVLDTNKFRCNLCNKSFIHRSKTLRHINTKHSLRRPFKCSMCDKSFKYKCDLKSHQSFHKSDSYHQCTDCSYQTKTKTNLKTHYIRKHTNEYKFACEVCGKLFKLEWDLKFHLESHADARQMCDFCGRFYASAHALYKHRKHAHLNVYEYTCEVCHKKLMTRANLESHLTQHSDAFQCEQCGKSFKMKKYLRSHALVHSADKKFACRLCEKSFGTPSRLRSHMRTHSTEKPFICDLCGRTFKRRNCMREHRARHPEAELND